MASWLIRSLKPRPGVQWEHDQQLWNFGGREAKLEELKVGLGSYMHMRSPGMGVGEGQSQTKISTELPSPHVLT